MADDELLAEYEVIRRAAKSHLHDALDEALDSTLCLILEAFQAEPDNAPIADTDKALVADAIIRNSLIRIFAERDIHLVRS